MEIRVNKSLIRTLARNLDKILILTNAPGSKNSSKASVEDLWTNPAEMDDGIVSISDYSDEVRIKINDLFLSDFSDVTLEAVKGLVDLNLSLGNKIKRITNKHKI